MIQVYTDVTFKNECIGLGYILYRREGEGREFCESSIRIINTRQDDREWCATRAEYRALISGVRAAITYDADYCWCYCDNEPVVRHIWADDPIDDDGYFSHAFLSMVCRFDEWHVSHIDREDNKRAHKLTEVAKEIIDEEYNE